MKKLVYYIIWITGIIGVYLFSHYIEGYSLRNAYFIVGLISLLLALLIEKIIGKDYPNNVNFTFDSLSKVFKEKSIKLSNIIVLIGSPFIVVGVVGMIVL